MKVPLVNLTEIEDKILELLLELQKPSIVKPSLEKVKKKKNGVLYPYTSNYSTKS